MKINTKTKVAAGLAMALSAATASAVGSFQALTSSAVGVEAASAGTLDATIAGNQVVLQTGAAYSSGAGARLVISLNNGATFADSTYTLEESTGGATGDTTHWTLAGGSPVGQSSIEFIRGTTAVNPGDEFILSGSSAVGQAITVNAPVASSGAEIDIDAQYKDSPTTVVEEYTSAEIFQYANEFAANVDSVAGAVVDVNDSRLTFVGGLASDAIALEYTHGNLANGVTLNDSDLVSIVLSGDMSDIASISAASNGNTQGTAVIDTAANTATFSLSASELFNEVNAGTTVSTVLTINTTGTSALATRSFTIQSGLNFETETDKNLVAEGTSAGSWSINGLQAKVSHLSLNSTGFVSWLKVVNEGTTVAEITADIIWTLADGTEGSVNSATLGSVDAGGVATVGEAAILAAMGNPTQLADVSMTVTVAGQVNLVHLIAEKKASNGRLAVPVYYNMGGANPRTWVQ